MTLSMALYRKINGSPYPDSLILEAKGLALLAQGLADAGVSEVRVPRVESVSEQELVMERVEAIAPTPALMSSLGRGLACLHRMAQARYGLDYDNCIGLSRQLNQLSGDWGEFFVESRLDCQVGLIADDAVRSGFAEILSRQKGRLATFLNRHCDYPSLVHGDLWSGNVLFGESEVWLIDPAVYYGDREVDLAMTELFGGFSEAFYQSYDEGLPRSRAYPTKKSIYNLYHTLNHYNLFGSSYLPACRRHLKVIESL